jgi:UDP-glucuronate decarboxylase
MIDSIIREDVEKIKSRLKKDDFVGKHFLVSGGSGFVGSWICDVLISFDGAVDCVDDLSTGKNENIDHLLDKKGFRFIEEDVRDFRDKAEYDYILHLASRASPEEYLQNPIKTLQANSVGSLNMLELASKHHAKILLASTSEVYGDAQVVPTPETYWGNVNPVGVRSCYDEGKRFGEALFMAYYRQQGLDVRIARIFNSYGPRLRAEGTYGRAISRFIVQALAHYPLTVYGRGAQTRSFCHITDTVVGLLLLLTSEKARGEVMNIGAPEEVTILALARRIKKLASSDSPIRFYPLPEDDPRRRCPDIRKAQKLLRWKPKISLEQGLTRTITWFQRNAQK